ncbi:MAG TPA: CAP domain-containing protein [Candidatus Limnocylindrales bacterium]|nr:CAP domain-containing protein [Candidatus Limnocylindrales bacterium]
MRRPDLVHVVPGRAAAVGLALALILLTGLAPIRPAAPVAAGTAETMEAKLLTLINADRGRLGLVPLRLHAGLLKLAGDRAATLASTGVLSHAAAGCLSCQLTSRSIQWYGHGEAIGGTGYAWGDPAVTSLFSAWKGSPSHWALFMSPTYNYVGIGVAYRTANANTYASIVLTESVDQTRPWAQLLTKTATGTTARWTWRGADTSLQTHMSGLRNFDVQYRRDSLSWSTIRPGTTATSLTLTGRARGHWYGVRIRSRDNRGYVSNWTAEFRVWIP